MNFSSVKFPSGTRYAGDWRRELHEMSGVGTYDFPDGSQYRGHFRGGRFHGFGRLTLVSPSRVTYFGVFERGRLVALVHMTFADGLRYDGGFDAAGVRAEGWRYLVPSDRRYVGELRDGLEGASRFKDPTATRPARSVFVGQFDTEEGVFNPRSGTVTNIPAPFPRTRFVSRAAEVAWIRAHCRFGGNAFHHCERSELDVPVHEACPQIVECNRRAVDALDAGEPERAWAEGCECAGPRGENICQVLQSRDPEASDASGCRVTPSSSPSCSSSFSASAELATSCLGMSDEALEFGEEEVEDGPSGFYYSSGSAGVLCGSRGHESVEQESDGFALSAGETTEFGGEDESTDLWRSSDERSSSTRSRESPS